MPIDDCIGEPYALGPSLYRVGCWHKLRVCKTLQMRTPSKGDSGTGIVTPPFVFATAVLAVAAVLAGPVARWVDLKQSKEALPLKASLGRLSPEALAPYRIVHRETLDPAVVDALGTEQYLRWTLEDETVPPTDPLRHANLMVTYYSGGSSLVPHTPDVCYLGAGYEPAQTHENMEIIVPSLGPGKDVVPIRVCSFVKTAVFNRDKTSVVYTFYCNGRFVATRTGVRLLTHDPRDTYAFFSKVEVGFPWATRRQNVEGAKKVFERLLPLLIEDHWPDFKAAERAARG